MQSLINLQSFIPFLVFFLSNFKYPILIPLYFLFLITSRFVSEKYKICIKIQNKNAIMWTFGYFLCLVWSHIHVRRLTLLQTMFVSLSFTVLNVWLLSILEIIQNDRLTSRIWSRILFSCSSINIYPDYHRKEDKMIPTRLHGDIMKQIKTSPVNVILHFMLIVFHFILVYSMGLSNIVFFITNVVNSFILTKYIGYKTETRIYSLYEDCYKERNLLV